MRQQYERPYAYEGFSGGLSPRQETHTHRNRGLKDDRSIGGVNHCKSTLALSEGLMDYVLGSCLRIMS